ncbi:MAG: hypothetical protein LBP35_00630 [Candidatus Ancillula trichonymphae]|nr:hypothetical protein [Candidatus Ancillula trichonymphae]
MQILVVLNVFILGSVPVRATVLPNTRPSDVQVSTTDDGADEPDNPDAAIIREAISVTPKEDAKVEDII